MSGKGFGDITVKQCNDIIIYNVLAVLLIKVYIIFCVYILILRGFKKGNTFLTYVPYNL